MTIKTQKIAPLIALRVISTLIIAYVLYSLDFTTGSSTGKIIICLLIGLLLTAVFIEKHIVRIGAGKK